jgi:riboflavin biosynthesis pyrimidine reductase
VVFVSRSAPPEHIERLRGTRRPVHTVADGNTGVAEALGILQERYGVRRALCEGGATLNAALIKLGAADELFVTIAPKLVGGRDNPTVVAGEPYHRETMPRLELLSWYHHQPTGEVFTRWRIRDRG